MFGRGKWWSWEPYGRGSIYGPFNVLHAEPGGGPVLRGQSSWRTVNGILIVSKRWGKLVFVFRRHGKWGI